MGIKNIAGYIIGTESSETMPKWLMVDFKHWLKGFSRDTLEGSV